MKKKIWLIAGLLGIGSLAFSLTTSFSASGQGDGRGQKIQYRHEMVNLLDDLRQYTEQRNPGFLLLSNNGLTLLDPSGNPADDVSRMQSSVDGVLLESCHFGWDLKDDEATPEESRKAMLETAAWAKNCGLPVLNIDYCFSRNNVREACRQNREDGFIGFAAKRRQLDVIQQVPAKSCKRDCSALKEVESFLVLLNPEHYTTKEQYLSALQSTNQDLLVIDLIYGGVPLTGQEVKTLKRKSDGSRRLVFAYMSVGEAESYRSYWRPEWNEKQPEWMDAANTDWTGSFKVKYWTKEWRSILYGSQDAYLDQILTADFDGAFLDVVDVYEYFQAKQEDAGQK